MSFPEVLLLVLMIGGMLTLVILMVRTVNGERKRRLKTYKGLTTAVITDVSIGNHGWSTADFKYKVGGKVYTGSDSVSITAEYLIKPGHIIRVAYDTEHPANCQPPEPIELTDILNLNDIEPPTKKRKKK